MNKLLLSLFLTACFVLSGAPSVFGQTDTDGDGIVDQIDNCPTVSNPNQANSDAITGLGTWLMNENAGTTITATDNVTTATLTNSPQWVTGRNGGSALQFNGSNQYASANLPLNGKSNATIATWIKTSVNQGSYFLSVPLYSNGNNGFDIGLDGGGSIRCCIVTSGGGGFCFSSNQNYSDNQWHHIAATYDGTTTKLYWDGNLVNTQANSGTITTDGNLIQIGRFGAYGAYYQGTIDEVFVTDRTLTANEITTLATQGFSDNQGDACDDDDDNDGVLDINDGCPLDKNKIAAGLYGAGFQSNTVFPNLNSGTYNLIVKDVNNCILNKNGNVITNPSVVTLVLDSTKQVKCNATATGAIYTTGTGGTGTKMYSKNNGTTWQTSSDFLNLPVGTYSLLEKDVNNCLSNSISTTLTQPSAISFSTAKTNETCNDANNGTITVTASGGVNTYEYSKNNGSTYQMSSIFTGLSAGNYAIKVRDANACTAASQTVTITQPLGFTLATLTTTTTCYGDADAKITVRNYGGSNGAPYQFSKNNGVSYQSDSVFTDLLAGNYFVKIKDASGCESPVRNLTVTQPALISFATVVSPVGCFMSNGVIGVTTVSGGTPQYKYARNGGVFQTNNAFTNLPVGVYPIQVKDSRGCVSAVASSTIGTDCIGNQGLIMHTPTQRIPIVILKISPNPTQSELNLEVNSLNNREQTFNFYDFLGRQVQSETRTLEQGINRLSFDCYALPQGVYLIVTPNSVGNNQPRRFMKL